MSSPKSKPRSKTIDPGQLLNELIQQENEAEGTRQNKKKAERASTEQGRTKLFDKNDEETGKECFKQQKPINACTAQPKTCKPNQKTSTEHQQHMETRNHVINLKPRNWDPPSPEISSSKGPEPI
jgi:hypothetical protein